MVCSSVPNSLPNPSHLDALSPSPFASRGTSMLWDKGGSFPYDGLFLLAHGYASEGIVRSNFPCDRHQASIEGSNDNSMVKVPHEVSLNANDFVRIRTGMQMVLKSSLLNEGLCSVQDESAGLVVSVMDPQPGESILECCAAPGGKTLYMASLMKGRGMVSALDINKGRLRLLIETAISHNVDQVITTIHADLRIFAEKRKVKFDKVLLDAPCSGLGVLSKRADLRWNRKLEDMEQLKGLQDELLNAAAMLVKPGGILVYSTCSIDQEENEDRVTAFLIKHSDFCIDSVEKYVPSSFVSERGFYFSNPVDHSLDGAFAARLARSL